MNENDYLISMFIDDELSLDEKVVFVENVHDSRKFKDEAVSLLNQERLLTKEIPDVRPIALTVPSRTRRLSMPLTLGMATAALAAAVVILSTVLFLQQNRPAETVAQAESAPYRFVVYEPEAGTVEISGSFTDWKKVPMEHLRSSGYWEVTIRLKPGEHSYTYILDGSRKISDPTMPASEPDDFGGQNSILYTGGNA